MAAFKLNICIKINYYKRMFSKIASRANLTSLTARSFRATAAANNKKPSIGDAVTILQSKVSGINQVVSIYTHISSDRVRMGQKLKQKIAPLFHIVSALLPFTPRSLRVSAIFMYQCGH